MKSILKRSPKHQPKDEPFDPFGLDDSGAFKDINVSTTQAAISSSKNISIQNNKPQQNQKSSIVDFGPQFDASFDASLQGNSVPTQVKRNPNASIDSDIFSQLFKVSDDRSNRTEGTSSVNSSFNSSTSLTPTKDQSNLSQNHSIASPVNNMTTMDYVHSKSKPPTKLPVFFNLHETMSCIYDDTNSSSQCNINSAIDLIPNKFIQGQTFYISLKDPNKHIGEITTYLDFARELTKYSEDPDDFVTKQRKKGCRIFQVDIPSSLVLLNAKPIHILKFSGSEFLRPIPLVCDAQ